MRLNTANNKRFYLFHKQQTLGLSAISGIIVALLLSTIAIANFYGLADIAKADDVPLTPPDTCFEFNAETKTITNYYDNEGNDGANPTCPRAISIPATIDGEVVEKIGYAAFSSKSLTAVTIPSSVNSIGDYAFSNNQISSLVIPNSVIYIDRYAFWQNQLTSLDIDMENIPDDLFRGIQVDSLVLGPSVRSIGNSSFLVSNLSQITIGSGVQSIGEWAFQGNNLTSLAIPNSVTSVGKYAFSIGKIESLSISSGLSGLEEGVFWRNNLSELTLSPNITSVGPATFKENNLSTVFIQGDTSFTVGSFSYNGLEKSTIPESLASDSLEMSEYYHINATMVSIFSNNPDFLRSRETHFGFANSTVAGKTITTGGYIINPTTLTTRHQAKTGTALSPANEAISSDASILDYKLAQFISNVIENDPRYIASKVTSLYRIGDTVSVAPETFSGYITPSSQTIILEGQNNEVTFTYKPMIKEVSFSHDRVVDEEKVDSTPPPGISSPIIANSSLEITDTTCSHLTSANLLAPNEIEVVNFEDKITILGGIDFTVACEIGGETTVNYTLGGIVQDPTKLRIYKYNPALKQLTDITSLVTVLNVDSDTIIEYSLIDGGELDEDGEANGLVIDPVVIGYEGELVSSENSEAAAVDTSDTVAYLADTGMNLRTVIGGTFGMIILGVITGRFVAWKIQLQ